MTDVTFSLNGLNLDLDDGTGDKLKVVEINWWDGAASTGSVYQHPFADWGWIDPAFSMSKRLVVRGTAKASSRPRLAALLRRLVQSIPLNDLGPLVGYEDAETKYLRVRQDEVGPRIVWQSDTLATWDMQLVAPDGRFLAGDGTAGANYSQSVMLPSVTGGLQVLGNVGTRTNHTVNPRAVSTTGWNYQNGTSEVSATTLETGTGPNGGSTTFIRRTITTAKTTGNSGWYRNETVPAGVAGDVWTTSAWVRSSAAIQIQLNMTYRVGAATVNSIIGTPVTLTPNVWTRIWTTGAATGSYDTLQGWSILTSGNIIPVGGTMDVTWQMAEKLGTLEEFFDGASTTAGIGTFAWTGTANASSSTYTGTWGGVQTPFQINATVISNNLTVHTVGDARPPMTFSILGPVVNPTVRTDDGQVMKFLTTLDAGQTLLVDLDRKTITLNGVNRRNVLVGDWIVPENGTVLYFDADFYNSTAQLTVAWYDAWS